MIYSRRIIKEACAMAKLGGEKLEVVKKHVRMVPQFSDETAHVIELVNFSLKDVRDILKQDAKMEGFRGEFKTVPFGLSFGIPGDASSFIPLQLVECDSDHCVEFNPANVRNHSFSSKQQDLIGSSIHDHTILTGIIVDNPVVVRSLCEWIAENK